MDNFNTQQAKQYNLTAKEATLLNAFIGELYAEEGFSDVSPQDLQQITGISKGSYKGVLGSLKKKGILYVEDKRYLGTTADIVYLIDTDLHPRWKSEKEEWAAYECAKSDAPELTWTEWSEANKNC